MFPVHRGDDAATRKLPEVDVTNGNELIVRPNRHPHLLMFTNVTL